jgi:carnitine O-acetyltransferase
MALQLAYHKTHNAPVATYETASTRLFLHGRTDVIRTLSEDSWKWVQAMREGGHDVSSRHHFKDELRSKRC